MFLMKFQSNWNENLPFVNAAAAARSLNEQTSLAPHEHSRSREAITPVFFFKKKRREKKEKKKKLETGFFFKKKFKKINKYIVKPKSKNIYIFL